MTVSDIEHPVVLLTGPTNGIGRAMFEQLLTHPRKPRLLLLGRDTQVLDSLTSRAEQFGLVGRAIRIDLADLDSTRAASAAVAHRLRAEKWGGIDAAILNAGAWFADRNRTSAQGFELTFAVNVLAQHALLAGIEPVLNRDGHVVLMGSSAHRGRKASFNLVPDPVWQSPARLSAPGPPEGSAGTGPRSSSNEGDVAYATSKLALVTLSHDWAERLAGRRVRLNCYDPGLVAGTGLTKDMPAYKYWVWKYLMPVMSVLPGATTPANTARQCVALALGDAHPELTDGYVEIGRRAQAEAATFDAERREQLWSWCVEHGSVTLS